MADEIRLKVGELTERGEAGRGIIRTGSESMRELGIKEGDIVEVEGSRKTAGIAVRSYPSDVGLKIVRMDGIMRRNCGSGVGEYARIRKVDVKEAKNVTLAPAQKGLVIHISPNLIRQNLYRRPVVKGDIIVPSPVVRRRDSETPTSFFEEFFGEGFFGIDSFFTPFPEETRFVVTDVNPKGVAFITDATELEIQPRAPEDMELEERGIPTVTYEDVGGMRGVVEKVREMIELPLRHPEIFERLGVEPPKGVLLYGPPGTGKTLLAKAVANESGANFISISGPEVMCVAKETPIILNPAGIVEAGKIPELSEHQNITGKYKSYYFKENPKVFGVDHNLKIDKDDIEYAIEVPVQKIYKVVLENGNEVKVSENQPFLAIDCEGKTEWKKAKELGADDYVAFVLKLPAGDRQKLEWWKQVENTFVKHKDKWVPIAEYDGDFSNIEAAYSSTKSNMKKMKAIKLPTETSPELLEFLGFMYSEGCISNEEVSISNTDNAIRKRVKDLFVKLFGIDKSRINENSTEKIVVYSKMLAEFLKKTFGFPEGRKGEELEISPMIFKCSEEEIARFLKAYMEGDGTVAFSKEGYPTFRFFSISRKALLGIKMLLATLGIRTKISPWETKLSKLWMIEILDGSGRRKFYETVKPEKQTEKLEEYFGNNHEFKDSVALPVHKLLKELKHVEGIRYGKEIKESSVEPYISGRKLLTIPKVKEIAELMRPYVKTETGRKILQQLDLLSNSDLGWMKIENVEIENKKAVLIDLGVKENSNFVEAENMLLLHNSKWYGQSEENLRKIFEDAEKNAPSIIFIDEIDSLAPKREEVTGEVERRVVSQLLTLMDGLKARGKVIVIAATNRPNAVDPAMRRGGRFDREIEIPVPDRNGRLEVLKIHARNMPLDKSVNLDHLADITYGYVGADIAALAKEAAMSALRRVLPEIKWKEDEELPREIIEKLVVTREDFDNALRVVEPSAMREVLVEVPKVKWEDIGGLEDIKQQLKEMVEWPLKNPESFKRVGIRPPKGVLLYGPPGCGKTLLARAVATESGANFISIKGPQIYSKWVGESEKAIRDIFRRARQVAPTVVFFDEIDALAPRRGVHTGSQVTETVVSQLLSEMSGLEEMQGVVVLAATNRPDMIDSALLRPGRFDRFVLVTPPDERTRLQILKIHTKSMPLKGVDLKTIAKRTEGFSGADLEALVREAGMNALRENLDSKEVREKHFEDALKRIMPSLTPTLQKHYTNFEERRKKIQEEKMKEEMPSYIG